MTAHVLMDAGESFAYFETMDGSLEWLQVVLEGEKVKYDMRFYILYCLLSHKRLHVSVVTQDHFENVAC